MESSKLFSTDLRRFELTHENISALNERTAIIRKWNWDYSAAHAFQRYALQLLDENPRMRILICCNHPRVLTNGRGLQKARKGEVLALKDFNPSEFAVLPYPLFQIERGGGLTFHHPGQFIFYPIVKLDPKNLSLSKMVTDIFESASSILGHQGLKNLTHNNKLMGLWCGPKKIASLGIAIEKLTTYHGMALNLNKDEEMMKSLSVLNPCGMDSKIYQSAEEILGSSELSLDAFADKFLENINHAWQ